MMLTLKSLSSAPSNTVRPTPTMPGLTSSIGMIRDWAPGSEARRTQANSAAAPERIFMLGFT